ncbi:hypothetical protein [Kutzneria sp. 744]|uniref:hypothetical protein n=1 Tax=Kutzneria sp. (strain 744) TaxID=345341 RepID=UPI0018DB796C|nr:hypothetical protein [Kutzneria sp. 744]
MLREATTGRNRVDERLILICADVATREVWAHSLWRGYTYLQLLAGQCTAEITLTAPDHREPRAFLADVENQAALQGYTLITTAQMQQIIDADSSGGAMTGALTLWNDTDPDNSDIETWTHSHHGPTRWTAWFWRGDLAAMRHLQALSARTEQNRAKLNAAKDMHREHLSALAAIHVRSVYLEAVSAIVEIRREDHASTWLDPRIVAVTSSHDDTLAVRHTDTLTRHWQQRALTHASRHLNEILKTNRPVPLQRDWHILNDGAIQRWVWTLPDPTDLPEPAPVPSVDH